jgi:hypothetical protein
MQVAQGLYWSCETGAVEKLTRYLTIIGTIQTEDPRTTSWPSGSCVPILADGTSSDVNTLRMSSFCVTFCGRAGHVYVWGHSCHFWGRDNPHVIHEWECQVRFRVSIWAGIIGGIVMDPYLLLLNDMVVFWKLFCLDCLKVCPTCEAEIVVSARWSSSPLWGICRDIFERYISRKVD